MSQQVYTVSGMTCQHCVASVSDEVAQVSTVQSVEVDLEAGRMVVTGEDVDEAAVLAAVQEAGYTGART